MPAKRTWLPWAVAAGLGLAACEMMYGPSSQDHILSLIVEDSLSDFDTVRILLLAPGSDDTLERLWYGALADVGMLRNLKPEKYRGGDADILIEAMRGDSIPYRRLVHYRGSGRKPDVEVFPALPKRPNRDTLPPEITLRGRHPDFLAYGGAYADSGADCRDLKEGNLDSLVVRTGGVDGSRPGAHELRYDCTDHAGNRAATVTRSVYVSLPPDTLPPVITLAGDDTVEIPRGSPFADSGAACRDERDGELAAGVQGKVDPLVAGEYALIYTCRDSAGNAAEKTRICRVFDPPDAEPPVISLTGSDSLDLVAGSPFTDPGIACRDERDGTLPVEVSGSVNALAEGRYVLTYRCRDKAGNAAEPKFRVVRVALPPDTAPPLLVMAGRDSMQVYLDSAFADPGAACEDGRDGKFPAAVAGSVDTHALGEYRLAYSCRDKAGNAAEGRTRTVTVVANPDRADPVLTLRGPDTLKVALRTAFTDPGADCLDGRDGALPVQISGTADVSKAGLYVLTYSCADAADNRAQAARVVKVFQPALAIPTLKEASLDTGSFYSVNNGYTGVGLMGGWPGDRYIGIVQFDLGKVFLPGLGSAKALFHTFGWGDGWNGQSFTVTIRLFRLKADWTEGTGNWYFHGGQTRNNGGAMLANYTLSEEVMANSRDPSDPVGVSNSDLDLVRRENLAELGIREVTVGYEARQSAASGSIPGPENLVPLELDLSEYVKTTPASQDRGLLIAVEGLPPGLRIAYPTKELGDGNFAPRLLLAY